MSQRKAPKQPNVWHGHNTDVHEDPQDLAHFSLTDGGEGPVLADAGLDPHDICLAQQPYQVNLWQFLLPEVYSIGQKTCAIFENYSVFSIPANEARGYPLNRCPQTYD
jgi:hypothetical protein